MKFTDLSINNNKLLAPFYSIIDIESNPLIDEEALNTRLLSRNITKDSQEKVLATIWFNLWIGETGLDTKQIIYYLYNE